MKIMRSFSQITNRLGKHLRVTYKKKIFKYTHKGMYFTHSYEIYLNKQYIDTVYGLTIYLDYYIENLIRKRLKIICKLKRKKNLKRYVRL